MKIFILFTLVTISVCDDLGGQIPTPINNGDTDNLYPQTFETQLHQQPQQQPPAGCRAHGSSSPISSSSSISSSSPSSSSFSSSSSSSSFSSSSTWSSFSSYTFTCESPYEHDYKDDKECVKHVLETIPEALMTAEKLLCKHYRNELYKRHQYYQELKTDLSNFAGCLGCAAGGLIDLQEELEQLGAEAGNFTGDVLIDLSEIIHETRLLEPVLDVSCVLLGGLLDSECVEAIVNHDISDIKENLKTLSCGVREEKLDSQVLSDLFRQVGCLEEDELPIPKTRELPLVGPVVNAVECLLVREEKLDSQVLSDLLRQVGCVEDDEPPILKTRRSVTGNMDRVLLPAVGGLLTKVQESPMVFSLLNSVGCVLDETVDSLLGEKSIVGGLVGGALGGGGGGGRGALL